MMDLIRTVIKRLKRLGIEQRHQKIEGAVIVRDYGVESAFLFSQGIEVHIVVVCDGPNLGQVKGSQTNRGGDQDALGCLARALLEYFVLPERHALRVLPFYGLEQQIQGGEILVILLSNLRVFQHPHDHGEVLLILWSLLEQMAALWCGSLDEIIDQLEDIFFISQIAEWVVSVRLLQVDQVEHPDFIPFAFQPSSGGCEHLHFRVSDDIIGVGLQDVWFDIAAGLGRAAAANNQDVEGAAVLVGVQAQADMAGQDLVLFLAEHGVDLPGRTPGGGAVLLAVPRAPLFRGVDA